jgi:hypothetical protein
MANDDTSRGQDGRPAQNAQPSRKTLRLTFQRVDGAVQLMRQERLDMIAPAMVGERPEVGKNSGFWIELHDANGAVVGHRIIHTPLRDAVEEHSPDGSIKRVVGAPASSTFEVLLPDQDEAATAVLIGPETRAATEAMPLSAAAGSQELARFKLSR